MNNATGAMRPSQQLGAAPGSPDGLPGFEGPEPGVPEDIDGAEFASSGEADVSSGMMTMMSSSLMT